MSTAASPFKEVAIPAKSQAQQIAMSITEHHPGKLYDRNKGMASMSKSDLHDFASTPRKGLPPLVRRLTKKRGQ